LFTEGVDRSRHIIVLLGPPGSGKGTHSAFLREHLGIPSISTGEILRAEVQSRSVVGRRVEAAMRAGKLVSDHLVNRIVASRIGHREFRGGFLLDGYPRTADQAAFLDGHLTCMGMPAPLVLHLDCPDDVLVQRMTSRRSCGHCGRLYNLLFHPPARPGRCDHDDSPLLQRLDDSEAVIRTRLEAYQRVAEPLIAWYRPGNYHRLDASRGAAHLHARLRQILAPEAAVLASSELAVA